MRFLFRLIPILLGIAALTPFVWMATSERGWLIMFATVAVLVWYGLFELFGRRIREADIWWSFGLLFFFIASAVGLFLLVERSFMRAGIAIIVALLVFLVTEQFYRWFYARRAPSYTLGVMVSLLEVCTMFFVGADLIGMRLLLAAPVWLVTLVGMTTVALLFLIGRVASGAALQAVIPALMIGVFMGELLGALFLLPTSFLVGGAVVAIAWYVIDGLSRVADLGLSLRGPALRYLVLGSALFVIVMTTARWT